MHRNRVLVLLVAATTTAEVGASCRSRAEIAAQYVDEPVYELAACIPAHDYLSTNETFLTAIGADKGFAEYMARRGHRDSDQAVTVKPRNAAAAAFMFDKDQAVWFFDGTCEDVPLNSTAMLKTREGCSTGYVFISCFDDVGILEVYPLGTD